MGKEDMPEEDPPWVKERHGVCKIHGRCIYLVKQNKDRLPIINGETEALGAEMSCPQSNSRPMTELGGEPRGPSLNLRPNALVLKGFPALRHSKQRSPCRRCGLYIVHITSTYLSMHRSLVLVM